jgi:hypothetical protein
MSAAHGQGLSDPQTRFSEPPSGEWNDDDFDVLADGAVVGRILKVHAAPVGSPWMWTLALHEDRTPTHGYAATREAAMAALARSWQREASWHRCKFARHESGFGRRLQFDAKMSHRRPGGEDSFAPSLLARTSPGRTPNAEPRGRGWPHAWRGPSQLDGCGRTRIA